MNRHERRKAEKLNQRMPSNVAQPSLNKEDLLLKEALSFYQQNKLQEALNIYLQVFAINPDNAVALHYLGIISSRAGLRDRAMQLLSQSLYLAPNNAEGCLYLADLYLQDNIAEAEKYYNQAIRIDPRFLEAYLKLGNLYREEDLYEKAATILRAALELDPQSKEALTQLGFIYMLQGHIELGIETINKVFVLDLDYAVAHRRLGIFYLHQGLTDKALYHYQRAQKSEPTNHIAHSEYLFAMHSDAQITPQEIYNETLNWAAHHTSSISTLFHMNDPDPTRRLRIGYVSADLKAHAVTQYLKPVLQSHDKSVVEIFCYANQKKSDSMTKILQSYADHWRNIAHLSDITAAKLVQEDKIDILIDLSGHTTGNRLLMFAQKPAPVQATWIGYFNTTGVKAIDYIITNRVLLPPEEEHLYVEKPLRLPNNSIVFNAYDLPIEVNALPALTNGYITFGCFNSLSKVQPEVIKLWAEILHRVPNSRLYMKNKAFDSKDICERYRIHFSELGIDKERLTLEGASGIEKYLRCYHDVDLGLDPFPYNGSTTTLDGLWMGVPVISIKGDRLAAHSGESWLGAVDLHEFIAATKAEYVEKAVAYANNLPSLAEVRQNLRHKLTTAPITNPRLFTRNLENAFREIWKQWCQTRTG